MIRYIAFIIGCILVTPAIAQHLSADALICDYKINPLGIGNSTPELGWQLVTSDENVMQQAYEIRVGTDADGILKDKDLVWSTGKINSDVSAHVVYAGKSLESRTRYYWQVRVWDNQGNRSAWSRVAWWEMGLLNESDWQASWITPLSDQPDARPRPVPMMRKAFAVNKPVRSARLYITSYGLYEAYINGQRVEQAHLTPGWTSYKNRLQYQVYDVTSMIAGGDNATGVMIGDGWFRGTIGFDPKKNHYGDNVALLYQLEITYTDGTSRTVLSDDTWVSSTGPILMSDIYNGEIYDARLEKEGWASAGYAPTDWKGVKILDLGKSNLVPTIGPPVITHETFKPVQIIKTPKGETVADFGQNLVGFVQLTVNGKVGDRVSLYHAEVLDKDGNFYTANLRSAKAELQYTLKGGGTETYAPHFTFMGFRYVKVEGFPGELKPEDLTAFAMYSDMNPTGTFECSDALVNQLQHNIQWGQKGNFLDIPTDCPQRDERLGWTGDAQVFSNTAAFNMNVANFFRKWLQDVAADQNPDGGVPFVIPNILGERAASSAGWADVATIIPSNMYHVYGDTRFLVKQYPSMKAWVDYMANHMGSDYLWNTGFHFGDWLFYRPADDNDGRAAVTDKYLIAQSFFIHSTQLLIDAANTLGKADDAAHYTDLLKHLKEAYMHEYVTPSGRLVSGTQTAYVLALNFDILPEDMRAEAAKRLADNVHSYDDHLTTGFLGTPYLCHVLSRFGYNDLAYKLLLQKTYPSWLYPVTMGATTIWERWDGIRPDSTFENAGMNSFNHYAYGAIGDWMYKVMVGLDAATPGYKIIKIAPQPGEGITYAKASYETLYGQVASGWSIENGSIRVDIKVPANTTAEVTLPKSGGKQVMEGGSPLSGVKAISKMETTGDTIHFTIGSGTYSFTYPWP